MCLKINDESATVLFIALMSGGVAMADSQSRALDIIKEYSGIDRYTYFTTGQKLTEYPPGLCGGTPLDNCDWAKYGEAVVLLSGVTLIIALVCLVFSVLFWMGRSFFFGGCNPTHGLMCPGPKLDPEVPGEGYTKCQVLVLKFLAIGFAIAAVPLFITAMTGNSASTKGVGDFGDTVLQKGNDTIASIEVISQNITATQASRVTGFNEYINDMINRLDDIVVHGKEVRDQGLEINEQSKKYSGYRNSVVLAGLIVGLVVCIVVAVAGLCNIPLLSCVGALSLVIVLPFMWIVFSAHYPINSLLSDVCLAYNTTGVSGLSNFTNPIVNEIFAGCENDTNIIPVFADLNELVYEMFDSVYNQTCGDRGYGAVCGQAIPVWTEPPNYNLPNDSFAIIVQCPNEPCNNETLPDYLDSPIVDFLVGCYIVADGAINTTITNPADCVLPDHLVTYNVTTVANVTVCNTTCANGLLRNVSDVVIDGYWALISFQGIYNESVIPLISCSNLMPFIEDIHGIVCVDEVNALTLLIAPTALFAILLIGVGVVGVLGQKRFNKKATQQHSGNEMA
ncbi:hypothetical protein DFA_00649 [Cavenderia fasciculata]|uniref:Transmembrane protein n=1 Tax=Cavenderia fasciculata TaxID=261658 RepID=F4PSZ5_CACFS|nr:uncharacterized protein DFA_00649 [Cavenderia fasciculata]EGG20784.1 hypothetical protein DFA_00649 [Cavenderia fasciculata]|eukprot:XP_004358634.1 hypothetical protein DFA_00649 [Cavenderia fasciculata]